jgi:hypothetical protein
LELSVILEMLLLPKQEVELSYRFSLRLAKLTQKLFGDDPKGTFEAGKKI